MASSGETQHSVGAPYPDVLQEGRAQVVQLPMWVDGALVAPSSATFTLYPPAGDAIVDAAAATITSSVATYPLTAANLTVDAAVNGDIQLGEGWQQVWVMTLSNGTTRTVDRETVLARRPIHPTVADTHLLDEYPDLTAFRGSSITSFQGFIDAAWREIVQRWTIEGGPRLHLVKSQWAFHKAHLELTLHKVWRYIGKNQRNENFLTVSRDHLEAYKAAWPAINVTTDDDHDGRVDDTEARTRRGLALHVNVPPARRRVGRRGFRRF